MLQFFDCFKMCFYRLFFFSRTMPSEIVAANVLALGVRREFYKPKLSIYNQTSKHKTNFKFTRKTPIAANHSWAIYYFFGKLNAIVYSFIKLSTSFAVFNLSPSITMCIQNRLFCNPSKVTYGFPFVTCGK